MSSKYKFYDNDRLYFVSFAVVDWIDVFTRNIYRDIVVNSLRYCQEHKALDLYAWVIMTNHLHLIIGSGKNALSNIMCDFKKHTSYELRTAIQKNSRESRRDWMTELFRRAGAGNNNNDKYQFWRQDNHPIALFNAEITHQKLNYLHNNPVVAGFVDKPEEFLYSSARDYYGTGKGLLNILLIDPQIITYS